MNKAKPTTGNLHGDNPLRELIRIFGLVERVMLPYFAQFGISGSQWGVLVNLKRAERAGSRGLRLRELSERLLIRPPSVTGLIDRLQRSRLVRRVSSQDDLRVRRGRPTKQLRLSSWRRSFRIERRAHYSRALRSQPEAVCVSSYAGQ